MNIIKRIIKYFYLKFKLKNKVHFYWTTKIGIDSKFEGGNLLQQNVAFSGEMGFGSYIAFDSIILGKVGRFTSIGPNVRFNSGKHPYTYPFASTSPWFYSENPLKIKNGPKFLSENYFEEYEMIDKKKWYAVEIGNDCWIGEGAFLVGGVRINDGAMVLAHAVVTKDVPPYAIVGGVPAKILGYRYSESDIDKLLKIQWWNNDIEWLKENANLLQDISKIILSYNDI